MKNIIFFVCIVLFLESGLETITIFWKPVPGASHYTLQMKQVGGRGGGGGEGGGDASPGSPTTSPVVAEEGEGEKKEKNKKDKNKDKKDSSTTWITLSSALSGTVVKKKHLERLADSDARRSFTCFSNKNHVERFAVSVV